MVRPPRAGLAVWTECELWCPHCPLAACSWLRLFGSRVSRFSLWTLTLLLRGVWRVAGTQAHSWPRTCELGSLRASVLRGRRRPCHDSHPMSSVRAVSDGPGRTMGCGLCMWLPGSSWEGPATPLFGRSVPDVAASTQDQLKLLLTSFLGKNTQREKAGPRAAGRSAGLREQSRRPRALPRPARPLSPPQPQGRGGLRGLWSSASATHRGRRVRRTHSCFWKRLLCYLGLLS